MLSANSSPPLREQLARLRSRLQRLDGLRRGLEDEPFRSRNTAHFASDEESEPANDQDEELQEKAFQKLNSTILAAQATPPQFKARKPLFQVNSKGLTQNPMARRSPNGKKKMPQGNRENSEQEFASILFNQTLTTASETQTFSSNHLKTAPQLGNNPLRHEAQTPLAKKDRIMKAPMRLYVKSEIAVSNPILVVAYNRTPSRSFISNSRPSSSLRQQSPLNPNKF